MADKKTIITIGREFGSGGHEIGATIAHDLGIKLYDKEMLKRAAKESGLCEDMFELHDEKPTYSFLYSLVMDHTSVATTGSGLPINHQIFLEQYNTIKKIADFASVILLVGLLLFIWQLYRGSIAIPFLKPYIVKALNHDDTDYQVTLDGVYLELVRSVQPLRIIASNVVYKKENAIIITEIPFETNNSPSI